MIIPCMNSTSAWKGGLGGVRTVASVRNLPGWPGAPGCTMGADCCADAAIVLSKNSATKDRLQRAMHHYTIRVFRQSIIRFRPPGARSVRSRSLGGRSLAGATVHRKAVNMLNRPRYSVHTYGIFLAA